MNEKRLKEARRSFDMPSEPPHENLRRRVGAMFVSGCLALTMFPALALAQPGAEGGSGQNGQNQLGAGPAFSSGSESQQFGEFGPSDYQFEQDNQQGGQGGDWQSQPIRPQAQEDNWQMGQGGEESAPVWTIQGSDQGQWSDGWPFGNSWNGQQPAQDNQERQSGQVSDNQGGQQGEAGQSGQPGGDLNGQLGQPGANGQQPPMIPEQARELIERVYEILGIDESEKPIENVMVKLGFAMQNVMANMMGQPGQQPGQSGHQPGQTGNGQPGSSPSGQPSQPDNSSNGQPGEGQPGNSSGIQQPGNGSGIQQPGQPGNGQPGNGNQNGMPGGMSNAPTSYDAANTPETSTVGGTYTSTADNENAVLVDGKQITLSDFTVNKTGSASGEDADFYGTNAGILANNQANLTITGATVTTDGAHANGVFSYGTGTSISISDSTITTIGNNSGGLMTTGGASLTAKNLTVNTSGNSSAAIRSDRGGGTVTATQGSYSTTGVGSPAIYSTADITVSDATLSATNSEAVVIEGGNSVTLNNANVTGSNTTLNGQSTVKTNVLIYQSMSGDASEGASSFTMAGGSLTSLTGSMFHVTNTSTTIELAGVKLTNAADSNDLLVATADSWGTSGKNGGHATVNLSSQTASGNITVDSVSSVDLNLTGNSSYTGAISNDGTVNVKVESGSTWTLTADSYVTSLDNAGTINLNGHTLYVNGKAYIA